MPNLHEACGWVLIVVAACWWSDSLIKLVRARRSGVRLRAIPLQAWSGLFTGLNFLACVVFLFNWYRWTWLNGIALALSAFSTVKFSAGYEEEDVDNFLDKLIAVLGASGELDPGLVRNAQFATTRLRPGYAMQDVDNFLDGVERVV
jgi:DivIVA domain-containing protein